MARSACPASSARRPSFDLFGMTFSLMPVASSMSAVYGTITWALKVVEPATVSASADAARSVEAPKHPMPIAVPSTAHHQEGLIAQLLAAAGKPGKWL